MRMSGWIVGGVALTVLGLAAAPPVAAEDPTVNVYNWSDYIGPDVIEGFTKETGIKVNYDVYDANETVEAKLAAGHSGYDIVVPTFVPFVARGIQAGLFRDDIDEVDLHMSISALCFFNVANRATFSRIFNREMATQQALARRREIVIDTIMRYVKREPE